MAKFTIEHCGKHSYAEADSLRLAKDGSVRLFLGRKLVGICRDREWYRVYLDADQPAKDHDAGEIR